MTRTVAGTLYITRPDAWVRLDGGNYVVSADGDGELLRVPVVHVDSIVLFGGSRITPQAAAATVAREGEVAHLGWGGRLESRHVPATGGSVLLRMEQFRAHESQGRRLAIARNIVAGKLANSRHTLLRSGRDTDGICMDRLRGAAENLKRLAREAIGSESVPAAMAIEGEGAKLYFSALDSGIRANGFRLPGRRKRPPTDRMNALLSFLYALLSVDASAALDSAGLDPQVGFLHSLRPGRPSLALDLMEEFRSPVADRLALTMVNRRELVPGDFREDCTGEQRAVFLSDTARKRVLAAYAERLAQDVPHPAYKSPMSRRLVIHTQARLLARHLRGDLPEYVPWAPRG